MTDAKPRSLNREILALAVPAFATLVTQPLLTLADSAIVGHLGTPQLAGLTLATTIVGVLVGLAVFLSYGTTATVARRLGAGHRAAALSGGMDGMTLGALIGVVLCLALEYGATAIIGLFGAAPDVSSHAVTYLRWVALGLPAQLVTLASTGVLRGLQDTRTPLWVAIGTNIVNIAANVFLVYGLGLGIAGAGIGTGVSQWAAATVLATIVIRGAQREQVSFSFRPAGVLAAGRSGLWLVLRAAALQGAIFVTTFTASATGAVGLAAHQIINSLWSLMSFALDAFAIAAQALIGLRLGAGDTASTRRITNRVLAWGVCFGVVVGLALLVSRPWTGQLFTSDVAVQQLAASTLLVVACLVPLAGVVFVLDGVLIGAGDARYLSLAATLATLVYLPCAFAVRWAGAGLSWLWAAYGVWIAVRAVTLVLRERSDAWLRTGGML